jgi:hypothetical protein
MRFEALELIKKSIILFSVSFALLFSPLLAAEKQLRVIVEKAPIYAESNTNSYRIENVRKGTLLTTFTSGGPKADWFYVSYQSKRWNSRVTGFIQASMVEEVSDKSPKIPAEKVQEKTEEIQPKIEKPKKPPAKVKPKTEQVIVKESLGFSSVPSFKPYVLPAFQWEEKPKRFLSIDAKPASVEHVDTKKIPDKYQDRQPPEVKVIKPEPEKKKPKPKKPPRPKKPRLPGQQSLLTMSVGYGPSAGSGLGGFVQLNTKMDVSFHLGAGYYPTSYFYSEYEWATNQVLFSAGIKYYLPFRSDRLRPFVDLQYGGVSIEAVRIFTRFWHFQTVYENIQKTLYGPSFLAGIEWRLKGNVGLNGAIGLSYNITEWDYWERDYFLTAEVGLLVYLW